MRSHWVLALAASLVGVAVVPLLLGGGESLQRALSLPPLALAGLLGMICLAWCCNAGRFHLLLGGMGRVPGYRSLLRVVVSAEFAGTATPAYAGGPAAYLYLLGQLGLRPGQSAAAVALDQLTDMVFFATALPVALLLLAVGQDLRGMGGGLILVALLPAMGVALLAWLPRHYRRLALALGRLMQRVPRVHRWRYRLARWLLQFRASVQAVLAMDRRRLVAVYLLCAAHWSLRYGILPVTVHLLGEDVPVAYLFVVQSVALFVGHLTAVPAGAGTADLTFAALLSAYLPAGSVASALLIWRFCTFHWYVLVGAPLLLVGAAGRSWLRGFSRRA